METIIDRNAEILNGLVSQLQAGIDHQCLNHVFSIGTTTEGFLRMQTRDFSGEVATDGLYDGSMVLDYFIKMGSYGADVFRQFNDRENLIDLVEIYFGNAEMYKWRK